MIDRDCRLPEGPFQGAPLEQTPRPELCRAATTVQSPRRPAPGSAFELQFRTISGNRCVFSFACDALGQVSIDELSESGRESYLYARTVIGGEMHAPVTVQVVPAGKSSLAMAQTDISTLHEDSP